MTERRGFELFQHRIEEIARALGGSPEARAIVADDFVRKLPAAVAAKRGVQSYSLPRNLWTATSPAEYEVCARFGVEAFAMNEPLLPVEAEAPWKGGTLRRRGLAVLLEGGHYGCEVASAFRDNKRDGRGGERLSWHVYIPDHVASAVDRGGGNVRATNVKSEESARSSLARLVSTFFGVELRPVQ